MGSKSNLKELKARIEDILPSSLSDIFVEFEGPELILYTRDVDYFAENTTVIKNIAKAIRKRVVIRPDPDILVDATEAERVIKEMIPEEAGVQAIIFDDDLGEVSIEALSPGVAIGKLGQNLNKIKLKLGWIPKVIRAPPINSKTVNDVRKYLYENRLERKEFLKTVGNHIHRSADMSDIWVRTVFLGGAREVGRSATLLMTKNSKVLVDCGLNVSAGKISPHLELPDVGTFDSIDAVVLTHAHLDHSGLIPFLVKYGFDGPIYTTQPTRDMAALLQLDYLKVAVGDGGRAPYDSEDIRKQVLHTIPVKYGDTTGIAPDIRLTLHNAGHIIGSAMAHFHIADGFYNIAFTGDMKFENTWLFNRAEKKFPRLEALIMESTYGGPNDFQPTHTEAKEDLKQIIERTFNRGGKIIIPVFAVGRSQEVMLVIEELMREGSIEEAPVYLDGMILEATAIHTAYPEYLNSDLRAKIFHQNQNPFLSSIFHNVDSPQVRKQILEENIDKCIVLATSGMMNGGPVLEYLKQWAHDETNSLVFVGYQAVDTIGNKLQKGTKELILNDKGTQKTVEINLEVNTCDGFSGHSDRHQLLRYLRKVTPKPKRVIFVHGEESKSIDISQTVSRKLGIDGYAPYNMEALRYK